MWRKEEPWSNGAKLNQEGEKSSISSSYALVRFCAFCGEIGWEGLNHGVHGMHRVKGIEGGSFRFDSVYSVHSVVQTLEMLGIRVRLPGNFFRLE